MIIDGHCHTFPHLGLANGHPSEEAHMRSMQVHMVAHTQPTIHTATRHVVREDTLSDGIHAGYEGLLDVNFRVGRNGRLEWTKDGEEYHMQWMPPSLQDMAAPPELMVAQLDFLGVDRGILHNAHVYGLFNDYFAECVRKFPDRLAASAQIHEARADQESEIQELRRAVKELGLIALHFQSEGFFVDDYREFLDDEKFTQFWEEVRALGIPVLWNIRPCAEPRPASYRDQIRRLGVWARRWPEIPSIFTHGVNVPLLADTRGVVTIPDVLWDVLSLDNVFLELLLPVMQGGCWDYPFPEGQEIVRQCYQKLGAGKMHWGSDMPCTERICTYRQSLDYLRRYCTFMSDADMDLVLGGDLKRLFGFS